MYEQAHSTDWGAPATVPQGFAVFGAGGDGAQGDARAAGRLLDGVRERGLHFPAMEAPDVLAADLQAFFGPLPVTGW